MKTRNLLLLLLLALLGYGLHRQPGGASAAFPDAGASGPAILHRVASVATPGSDSAIDLAYAEHARNLQVAGQGLIVKLLPDDDEGSRHQKFLLQMPSGLTILIAHNIDLAPRLPGLRTGDVVEFSGEYAWNNKGGVVHWTHADPAGRHVAGWLKHAGLIYQ